jgi:hypothetical protein
MALSKLVISIFFLCFNSVVVANEIVLPEISTKQSINNLRYISANGKFTYYQRRSGSLLLSTNYDVEEVLSSEVGTQYTVTSSVYRKYNLIEQSLNFHTNLSIRKSSKIYYTDFGKRNVKFIGNGIDAKLHYKDKWISYFSPFTGKISFNNLVNPSASFEIMLQNKKNPYFIPQRVMLSDKVILYTDVNKEGVQGLISFNRVNSKTKLLQKAETEFLRYELCATRQHVYLGSFSSNKKSPYSSITQYQMKDFNLGKGSILYDNNKNDIGQIICNKDIEKIYFIKDQSKEYNSTGFEAAKLDISSKKIQILTSQKWVNSIVNMDGRLLIPFRGSYYVLEGEHNSQTKDNLEKSNSEDKK